MHGLASRTSLPGPVSELEAPRPLYLNYPGKAHDFFLDITADYFDIVARNMENLSKQKYERTPFPKKQPAKIASAAVKQETLSPPPLFSSKADWTGDNDITTQNLRTAAAIPVKLFEDLAMSEMGIGEVEGATSIVFSLSLLSINDGIIDIEFLSRFKQSHPAAQLAVGAEKENYICGETPVIFLAVVAELTSAYFCQLVEITLDKYISHPELCGG